MKIRGFITHKKAETYVDCQDFFAVNSGKKSVAISDGMSQSIFPQWWAKELVTAWNENDWQPNNTDESLSLWREAWLNRVLTFLESEKSKGKNPYRLENSLTEKRGAGATLCAIKFIDNQWNGYVLGDSCLIIVNADNNITDILRSNEGEFGNHPEFFDSMIGGKGEVKPIAGVLHPLCKLLLVSDPFAEFLYEKQKTHQESTFIQQLLDVQSHESFVALVERWREEEGMHNDDSTLVIIEPNDTQEFILESIDDLAQLCKEEQQRLEESQKQTEAISPIISPITEPQITSTIPSSEQNLSDDVYCLLEDIKTFLIQKVKPIFLKRIVKKKSNKTLDQLNSYIRTIDTILNRNNNANK